MPPTILVVDDNEMNRDMLSRRLQRQNYDVEIAVDGESALDQVHQKNYDLILLDIMMPGMSGYEVLERLKADHKTRHIPVIMISAVDDLDSVVRCIEMGAEDYLFKPFNPVLLKARIGAILSKYARQIPLYRIHELTTELHQTLQAMQTDGRISPENPLRPILDQLQNILDQSTTDGDEKP